MSTKKQGPGRTPKLTPMVQEELCNYLKLGNTLEDSAIKAGVGASTAFLWLRKAKEPDADKKYIEFLAAITNAQSEYRVLANAQMLTHGKRNWKALAWFLERTQPKYYGLRVKVSVNEEMEALFERFREHMTPAEYERACEIATLRGDSGETVSGDPQSFGTEGDRLASRLGSAINAALSSPETSE